MAESELAGGEQQANARLLAEAAAQLTDSASRLERASGLLPTDEEFHFYSNFSEFRVPVQGIQARVQGLLSQISSLNALPRVPALPSDPDNLPDWLVSMQDELLEQVDSAFDAFKKERAQQGLPPPENDAFMYQNARKKRRGDELLKKTKLQHRDEVKAVSMTEKKADRCPIPFHVWSIPRPQERFDAPVDNSNTPFKHPKPLSGSSQNAELDASAHPLQENLQNMKFEDIDSIADDFKPPASLTETPFTFVNTPSLLKDVATKLSLEREIAVDLEHHQFRSFQGLTCLMQISTRSEDFIIDTLELWSIIGPHLYDVFANPAIQKVMHGAKGDVAWLQRDFGIYVCNLFDTGQAARVLELQSFGLAYLLERFCGLVPDKRYQMADWRLRPLPAEMLKYAREDTHYLLYVGDLLKQMLVSCQSKDQQEPLLEVYERSRGICLTLYEKEITTETSYLQVYGLEERNFRPQQLAVLSGLYSWRDRVARVEDESTGYVLPNHLLLKLAEEMPDDVKKLRALLNGRHTLVARNIATIVDIISTSKSVSSLESEGIVRLQAAKSKPSAIFEEIAFPESAPLLSEVTEDEVMLQQADKVSDMKAGKVTLEVQGVQKTSSVHLSENTTMDFMPDLSCGADENVLNSATVVLNRATKSSLFEKQKVREKPEDKLENQKETHYGVVVAGKDKSLEVSTVENTGAAVPSGVILKRASGSSLFLKSKKSNRAVQEVPNLLLTTTEKQEASSQKSQADDVAFLLGNRTSFQTDIKGDAKNEDPEQAEAKFRVERIRASFSLPFHAFDGGNSSFEPATRHGKERAEQIFDETRAADPEQQQAEDLIIIEIDSRESFDDQETKEPSYSVSKGIGCSSDGIQHRVWWPNSLGIVQEPSLDSTMLMELPDSSDPRSLETDIPLSLSQKFRPSRHQREGIQSEPQFSQLRANDAIPSENERPAMRHQSGSPSSYQHMDPRSGVGVPSFTPFDYAAAKKNMGFFKGRRSEARAGTEGPSSAGNQTGSSERIFDPQRRVKEFKPEGISSGKRRQVFPQTGNRTGVFK